MKSPEIHRVLVYTDKEGIIGWWTHGLMSPTPQCLKKQRNVDKKNTVRVTAEKLEKNDTSYEIV